ncbi:putative nucleotidyltransferase [Clostridium pascui]|uniref:nucleotidyltransferase n=1 Tax=Clostridium pascui TaxID=46609 RepID=UPI00195822F1|nr:nucleotidyltransferase [Clostridium pascui]MBM7868943.1 putative nucleotidyltransferase [Clostridium pascui]
MKIAGIVVEYNPLHNGHVLHIKKTKEITKCDGVIAVMSGHFVQRGTPSILDKWTRTKMALLNGVDLVIELPLIYSISSAEFFAWGSMSLLNSLGIVDSLCFGSESGNILDIMKISNILVNEPLEFKISLKKHLDEGNTFPLARNLALYEYLGNNEKNCLSFNNFFASSNNILGIEYCKNLLKLNSNIEAFTTSRQGNSYNSLDLSSKFSSATAIRNYLQNNTDVNHIKYFTPDSVWNILESFKKNSYSFDFEDKVLNYIKYKYISGIGDTEKIPEASEGLSNRINSFIISSNNMKELIMNIKTKRYTYSRISRILYQYFLNFDTFNYNTLRRNPCPYARILGFNSIGREMLKQMKKSSSIPIYTKLPKHLPEILEIDIKATKSYSLINNFVDPFADYKTKPIILE